MLNVLYNGVLSMDNAQFEQILIERENALVEFKQSLSTSLAKEIVAFTNTAGGKIFIGVNDDNDVIGYQLTNKDRSQIQNMGNTCDPSVPLQISTFIYNGKEVAIVEVPESRIKPVQCSEGFYIRNGPNSKKMTREEIIYSASRSGLLRYESLLRDDFNYPIDFDVIKFDELLKRMGITKTISNDQILSNLGLAKLNGKIIINNAGILFFGNNRQLYIRQAYVTCVLYKGIDKTFIIDRKDFRDDLLTDYENAFKFLQQHLKLKYEITDGGPRTEIPEIPYEALRESLLNAIIHRDYAEEGARVMVEIYDDRVEISNPGQLLFKKPQLGKASISRNPIIFDIFNRTGLVEKVGSGISRIKNAMKERELDVTFDTDDFFIVTFQRLSIDDTLEQKRSELERQISDLNQIISVNQALIILNICYDEILSAKEISKNMGHNRLHKSDKKELSELVANGLLAYTIPDKPRSPKQKYKITKKGLQYLKDKQPEFFSDN